MDDINGLVQEKRNSIANTLELRLSCTDPSISVYPRHELNWNGPAWPFTLCVTSAMWSYQLQITWSEEHFRLVLTHFSLDKVSDILTHWVLNKMALFTPQPKGSGVLSYPERAGRRAAGQTSPVNTLTSILFHGSFSNLARTFITLRSRTTSIMEVLPH